MSEDGDHDYYVARARACRRLAAIAATPAVGIVHEAFATLYERAARETVATLLHRHDPVGVRHGSAMTMVD